MTEVPSSEAIGVRILVIRDQQIMLDSDLAELYGVSTRHLNEQVKRNRRRFPPDFMFRLTDEEWASVGRPPGRRARHRPYAFTEPGAGMLASVLRGPIAGRVTVAILRTFRRLRPDEGPTPDAFYERKVHGLFAAIRDAVRVQPRDVDFTTSEPYTYFIQVGEDGPIKIGWTRNLLVRLRSFASMFPMPLRLLGVIPGDMEDSCHRRFAAFRVGGECFTPSPVVLEFIRNRAQAPPESCQWFGTK